MLDLAASGVVAVALLVPFVLAVALVRRYPPAGIGLTALIIIPLWEVPHPPPIITTGGLSITSTDVITLTLFVVGLLEYAQLRDNLQGWLIPWLLLGALIAVSLLRGAATFGLGSATNEGRAEVWFFFAMTWALSVRPERFRLRTASLAVGWALVLIALYHAVKYGIGGPTSRVVVGDDGSSRGGRVLIAGQAVALLLCAGTVFFGTHRADKGHGRYTWSAMVFLGVVLISQHRSVWIAGFLGIIAVMISARGERAGGRAFTLVAVGAWVAFTGWVVQNVGRGVVESALNTDTLDWRTTSWQTLTSQAIDRGPLTIATGEPFGGGFLRQIGPRATNVTGVQAHNWYVELFLRSGIFGLMVFAAILIAAVLKSRARSPEWTFTVVAIGIYASAYPVEWFLAPWFAAAIVVALRGSAFAPKVPEPVPVDGPAPPKDAQPLGSRSLLVERNSRYDAFACRPGNRGLSGSVR